MDCRRPHTRPIAYRAGPVEWVYAFHGCHFAVMNTTLIILTRCTHHLLFTNFPGIDPNPAGPMSVGMPGRPERVAFYVFINVTLAEQRPGPGRDSIETSTTDGLAVCLCVEVHKQVAHD